MTVGAPDVAFLDLSENVHPARMVAHEVNDRGLLVGPMVELKYDGICFAAIDARVRQKVSPPLASSVEREGVGRRVL